MESKNTLYKASWVTPTLAAASQPVACSWLTCSVAVVILTSHAACNRCCRVQELLAQAEQLVPDGDLPALQVGPSERLGFL